MTRPLCSEETCNEEANSAKGFCHTHYKRQKEGRPMNATVKKRVKGGAICTIIDTEGRKCTRKAVSRGLCPTHNGRKNRGGDLYAPVRDYIETDDLEARLRHYSPPGAPNDCWEYAGCRNKDYGMVSIADSKLRGAHIVAWEIANDRELPEGMVIRHSCDNPPCTNPAHLLLGSHQDNIADKVERGRQDAGEKHGNAKLTNEIVLEICRLYDEGESQTKIAEKFDTDQSHISQITRGELWGHITHRTPAEKPRHVKLSQPEADEIRRLYATGAWTYSRLGKRFAVSHGTVAAVLADKIWVSTS